MNFKDEIVRLEEEKNSNNIFVLNGNNPILLTSVHSMMQFKEDGSIKLLEYFTKAITKYVSLKTNSCCMIKENDDGIDPNKVDYDEFKIKANEFINKNNIKLVLDIHGASIDRAFDVELGTLNNLSADYSTIYELKEAFEENGIKNIVINDPFKGGKVTQYLYMSSLVDVVQIEINQKYRDYNDLDKIESICKSLIKFINQYIETINK